MGHAVFGVFRQQQIEQKAQFRIAFADHRNAKITGTEGICGIGQTQAAFPRRVPVTLVAILRQNRLHVAHEIYALGKRAHGVAAMRAGGLFLNQLLYACCREASMLDKALEVWADLQAAGEAVEAEPVGKLILACLAKSKYDDAFGAFLAAIVAAVVLAPRCVPTQTEVREQERAKLDRQLGDYLKRGEYIVRVEI